MRILCVEDLADQTSLKQSLADHFVEDLISDERSVIDLEMVRAHLNEVLNSLPVRRDVAFIAVGSLQNDLVGYALVTTHLNVWTNTTEAFIYIFWLAASLIESVMVSELLQAIEGWATERQYEVLRIEVRRPNESDDLIMRLHDAGWSSCGLVPCRLLLRSDDKLADSQQISDGLSVRSARESDHPFIVGLLSEAIWLGLSKQEQQGLSPELLKKRTRQDFEDVLSAIGNTGFSLVLESATEGLCGHVTVRDGYVDAILGVPEAELIDVFLLPHYRGRGIGDILVSHALKACQDRGAVLVRSTLVLENEHPARVQQLCDGLQSKGWWFYSHILYKRLLPE